VGKTFDAYEYTAVIAPGAVLAALIASQCPAIKDLFADKDLSIGDFGLFLIAAFILGQFVQILAALLERALWLGGMPTDWAKGPSNRLLAADQRARLQARLHALKLTTHPLADIKTHDWRALTREIYSRVNAAGRSERVDAFNRTYGLMKGLAAAFLAAAAWLFVSDRDQALYWGLALALGLASLWRAYEFGIDYGREMMVEFLHLA
jgi:hypothetical protein